MNESNIINLKGICADTHVSKWVRIDHYEIDLSDPDVIDIWMQGVVSDLCEDKGIWEDVRRGCERSMLCRFVDSVDIEWVDRGGFYGLFIDGVLIVAGDIKPLRQIKKRLINHILGK